ncbi:MAG: type II toxin-antitoxin system VapC family toxin [Acidimicrobiia bacterium]|nr:type II toxin-antitoxin system VapC family toxin [Acidimicrobiia bacterium]
MRLLLDTHALLWWLAGDRRLPPKARRAIEDRSNTKFVSAASAWEIATKTRVGRLPGGEKVADEVPEWLFDQGFVGLDITVRHAQHAGGLPGEHRDPFDRMLIAQALIEGLTLVSNDEIFDAYGVRRFW